MCNDGSDVLMLTIVVTDADHPGTPVTNYVVNLSTDRGANPTINFFDDNNQPPQYNVVNPTGTKVVYYTDHNLTTSPAHIVATIGSYTSNVVTITMTQAPSACTHNVALNGLPATTDKSNNYYNITVPLPYPSHEH